MHPAELPAGRGVQPGHASQVLGQRGGDGLVPLRVPSQLPVRDLLEEGGPRGVDLAGVGVAKGSLRGRDLLGKTRG